MKNYPPIVVIVLLCAGLVWLLTGTETEAPKQVKGSLAALEEPAKPPEKVAARPMDQRRVTEDIELETAQGLVRVEVDDPRRALCTILGKIEPTELLAQMRERASLPPYGEVPKKWKRYVPGVRVVQRDPETRQKRVIPLGGTDWVDIDDNGVFRLDGIPIGTWQLEVIWHLRKKKEDTESYRRFIYGGTIADLTRGEVREVHLYLHHLLWGKLHGQLYHNNLPLASTAVYLTGVTDEEQANDRNKTFRVPELRTDSEGRFSLNCPQGVYTVGFKVPNGDPRTQIYYNMAPETTVVAGQETHATMQISTTTLHVTVIGSDGHPVHGVCLAEASRTSADYYQYLPVTDIHGKTSQIYRTTLLGSTRDLYVVPKELTGEHLVNTLTFRGVAELEAFKAKLFKVGNATVKTEDTELVVHLPETAGY